MDNKLQVDKRRTSRFYEAPDLDSCKFLEILEKNVADVERGRALLDRYRPRRHYTGVAYAKLLFQQRLRDVNSNVGKSIANGRAIAALSKPIKQGLAKSKQVGRSSQSVLLAVCVARMLVKLREAKELRANVQRAKERNRNRSGSPKPNANARPVRRRSSVSFNQDAEDEKQASATAHQAESGGIGQYSTRSSDLHQRDIDTHTGVTTTDAFKKIEGEMHART